MPETREELFEKAKQLNESEKYDEAIEVLKELANLDIEVNNSEMELINWVVAGKIMRYINKLALLIIVQLKALSIFRS